jgi:hypothetical protein
MINFIKEMPGLKEIQNDLDFKTIITNKFLDYFMVIIKKASHRY